VASILTLDIGRGTTGLITPHENIVGTSIGAFGDSSNTAGANHTWDASEYVAWGWTALGRRSIPLWSIPTSALPESASIARARFRVRVVGKSWGGGIAVGSSGLTLSIYELETSLSSGTDWQEPGTGRTWAGSSYGPVPGQDYDATALGTATMTSTQFGGLGGLSDYMGAFYLDFDVTAGIQRAKDAGDPLDVVLPLPTTMTWPGAATAYQLSFDDPSYSGVVNGVHTYLEVQYWPALAVLESDTAEANRPPDFAYLHDESLAGRKSKTYFDAVEEGSASPVKKYWAWNFRTSGSRRHVIVGTGRAETTPVDNSASVSGKTLRSVDVYDRASGEHSPAGDLRVFTDSGDITKWEAELTLEDGTVLVLEEESTANTSVTFADDHIMVRADTSDRVLKIRADKWSATAANVTDEWTCSIRPDLRDTDGEAAALTMAHVMPAASGKGDSADAGETRPLDHAFTQQLWDAAADEDIAGTVHTHLPVRDVSATGWGVGERVTLFSADGATTVDAAIEAIYASDHGTYPDEIRLTSALAEVAVIDETWTITGGTYLGNFPAFEFGRLSSAVAAGATSLPLVSAFTSTPTEIVVVDTTTGSAERRTVSSGTTTLVVTSGLTALKSEGSLVFSAIDPVTNPNETPGAPFFVQVEVPDGQSLGGYDNSYRLFERKLVTT
jgi:hypothetical protein